MSVWPGEIVAGKYRVDRVLGKGGFGEVVAATHIQLGQKVALKVLLDHAAAQPALVERFLREARTTVQLRSQHVARVLDIATLPSGIPYIVMEYLDGEDFGRVVARNGPFSVTAAATWVLDACEAVAEAHALGIVHRDLKPANLFLARGAGGATVVKVLDFGVSKIAPSLEEQRLTRTHAVLGSPLYASPEQLRSTKHVDERTDIWALGVTLFELVTGYVPFPGTTLAELTIKVAADPSPSLPRGVRAPAGFEALIDRCLEKEPADRFEDIGQFARALAPFAGPLGPQRADRVDRALGRPVRTPSRRTRARSAPQVATRAAGELGPTRRRGWRPLLVAGLVASVALGLLAVVLAQSRDGGAPIPAVAGDAAPVSSDALAEAKDAARQGQWARAILKADDVLRAKPGDPDAAAVGAIAACNLGDQAAARKYVSKLGGQRAVMAKQICAGKGITVEP